MIYLTYLVYAVHIIISLFLILVVLLQQGKGADLSVFGGGASQAAFGARGAASLLHKMTVICFVLFIVTTLSIGILQTRATSSVISDAVLEETEAGTEPALDDSSEPLITEPDETSAEGEGESTEDGGEGEAESPR